MTSQPRLILRTDVLKQLLAAVAVVPAGVKLSIPQLRDALVSQADVLDGIATLVAAGELDATTLRPPIERRPIENSRPVSGSALAKQLSDYCDRHELAAHRVGKHLFGGGNTIARLRATARPNQATIDKVEAFVAGDPPEELKRREAGGARVAENGGVSGAELAARLDALIAEHGLSKCAVGMHVYGNSHGVDVLRQSNPRRRTVEKILALLADPPIDKLKPKRGPLGDRRFAGNRDTPARHAGPSKPTVASSERSGGEEPSQQGAGGAESTPPPAPDPSPVRTIAPGVRKARSYCLTPGRCTAPSRGPCRKCPIKRDPTQPPSTPLADERDRQDRRKGAHGAAIRRGQEAEAARKLDAGERPKNTFEQNLMGEVSRRRAEEARQQDPVEQAKLALQRKGLTVYSAIVTGGRKDRFIVSGQQRELTPAELIELAERKTGQTFRKGIIYSRAAA